MGRRLWSEDDVDVEIDRENERDDIRLEVEA